MYKKIKNSSFMNWLWFLMYLFPILFIFISLIVFGNQYNTETNELIFDSINFDVFLNDIANSIDNYFFDLYDSPIFTMFKSIIKIFVGGNIFDDYYFINLICYIFTYWVIITLVHLAFDFLMLLPNICHKFMEKVGGERD